MFGTPANTPLMPSWHGELAQVEGELDEKHWILDRAECLVYPDKYVIGANSLQPREIKILRQMAAEGYTEAGYSNPAELLKKLPQL